MIEMIISILFLHMKNLKFWHKVEKYVIIVAFFFYIVYIGRSNLVGKKKKKKSYFDIKEKTKRCYMNPSSTVLVALVWSTGFGLSVV